MTVQELIEQLEKIDDKSTRKVMLSADPEGNAFHMLYEVGECCVHYDGRLASPEWGEDTGPKAQEALKHGELVVVLWP